jgi:hypothetical protein
VVDFGDIRNRLQWLRGEDGVTSEHEAVDVLGSIILPLLAAEGLQLVVPKNPESVPLDFAAKCANERDGQLSVAIEYKHGNKERLSAPYVHQWLGRISSGPFNRALLIARGGFSKSASLVATEAGVAVELLDLDGVKAWIDRAEEHRPPIGQKVHLLLKSLSHSFAELVNDDPSALDHLEWRDLERMMHRVMEGLGFSAVLTPPSKDGGKDIVLTCVVRGQEESFIVELKHWRSGKRVGSSSVRDFLQIVISENRTAGLFLSTSGYAKGAFESLTEIERHRVRSGGRTRIALLVKDYIRADSGLWTPPDELPTLLFSEERD